MQIASITTNKQGEYEYATEEDYLEQTLDIIIQKEGFERKNISYEIYKAEIKSDILLNKLEKGTKEKTRIFGTIRNSKNRDPVKAASITLSIEGTQIAAITSDELGGYEYTAEEGYTGQTLDYVIKKEGFIRQDISHEIDRFEIKSDFLMDKIEVEIKIKGKTCDKAGNPVANASVSFSIGGSTIDVKSDHDGSFYLTVGQQFLHQSIGYEASKKGFKVKSGKLELIEDLKCINLNPIVPFWNLFKVAVVLIALFSLAIVAYMIIQDGPDGPELAIDPDPLNFNFRHDTRPQTFSVWNEGDENLEWKVSTDRDWITVTPTSGTETGTVIVSINSADLRPDIYTGSITVTSNGGTKTGIISLDINEPPIIIHYFMADPEYIDDAGGKSTLRWEVSGATSVTIDGIGEVDSAGEIVVEPDETTIYILRATNEAGKDVKTVMVTVEGIPPVLPRIDYFVANPASISAGEEFTLQWEVSGAESVTIDGIEVDPDGEIVVEPDETTIYTLRAINEAGKDVKTVTVTVEISYNFGDVVKSFSAPEGTQPSGLAWDGSNLWMSSYMKEGGIYKLDPKDGSVLDKCTPSAARYNGYGGLTYDGTYLLEADGYGSGIYKLSSSDCSIVSTIPSPDKYPKDLAWDGSYLWLRGYPSLKIYKVSPSDGSEVDSYSPPGGGQNAGLTYDGAYLWLSGTDDMIYKIDPSDFSVISSFSAPCSRPESLAWDGKYLWCASFDEGKIYQIYIGGMRRI